MFMNNKNDLSQQKSIFKVICVSIKIKSYFQTILKIYLLLCVTKYNVLII
jgi:hypothetical protein